MVKEKKKDKYQKPEIKVKDFEVQLLYVQRNFNTSDLMGNNQIAAVTPS